MNAPQHDINTAYTAYAACHALRRSYGRCLQYAYGDQWAETPRDDIFYGPDGSVPDDTSPRVPHNLIRQIVAAIIGRYRTDHASSRRRRSPLLAEERLAELDARALETFLLSGCAVQRICRENRGGGLAVHIDNVEPRRFFVNRYADPRGGDIHTIGMLHDMLPAEVINRFGGGSSYRARRLSDHFSACIDNHEYVSDVTGIADSPAARSFLNTGPGKWRVIELWTLDAAETLTCHDTHTGSTYAAAPSALASIAADNADRAANGRGDVRVRSDLDIRWHYRYFAPDGTVIAEGDSPYGHGCHPFAIKLYPLAGGEVHPFVEGLIEQQCNINRLLSLVYHIMASSAKGALLFPVSQLPKGWSWADIARQWSRPDSIIPIAGRTDQMPLQVSASGAADSAYRLLQMQLDLFKQASGVSDALMGRDVSAATGSDLYRQLSENSTIAIADLLGAFDDFIAMRDTKVSDLKSKN